MAPHRVFVYGTLKQGFRNYHVNRGTRLPGDFVTVLAFPLLVIGEFGLPWLVHEPGRGQPIRGQVFEVDDAGLAALDVLERVAEPGWYTRRPLAVAPVDAGTSVDAMAYFGDAGRVANATLHAGPIGEYTLELQTRYRWHL